MLFEGVLLGSADSITPTFCKSGYRFTVEHLSPPFLVDNAITARSNARPKKNNNRAKMAVVATHRCQPTFNRTRK